MRNLILHFTVLPVAIAIAIAVGLLVHDVVVGVVVGMASSIIILAVVNRVWKSHA